MTNLAGFYDKSYSAPPLGLSDHLSLFVLPMVRIKEKQCKEMIYVRDKRPSTVRRLGRFLCEVPWDLVVTPKLSCEQNLSNFTNVIDYGLNTLMPLRAVKVHANDKPWMNKNLKILIRRRQKAFTQNNQTLCKKLRNKINGIRKKCRKMYYEAKMKELKQSKPKDWWKEVKRLCGLPIDPAGSKKENILSSLEQDIQYLDFQSLSNLVNNSFLEPIQNYSSPTRYCSLCPRE